MSNLQTEVLYKEKVLNELNAALEIKDGYIFDIVNEPFNLSEFGFFPKLAYLLSNFGAETTKQTLEIGLLSETVYLSTKIHFATKEGHIDQVGFRGDVQFPVLAGDLLSGRFFERVTRNDAFDYLDIYINYLIGFNGTMVDFLLGKTGLDELIMAHFAELSRITGSCLMQSLPYALPIKENLVELSYLAGLYYGYMIFDKLNDPKALAAKEQLIEKLTLVDGLVPAGGLKEEWMLWLFMELPNEVKIKIDTFSALEKVYTAKR